MSSDILIIVPTYNERENIEPLVQGALGQLPEAHVLVVDDHSPDGTAALVQRMGQRDARVALLQRPGKLGLGTAYIAGFRYGLARDYPYLIEMDADFSHDPRYLPVLVERARSGVDLVLGSRYVPQGGTENWSFCRRTISKGGNIYARAILGVGIQDLTGGFKCFNRRVLEALNLDAIRSEGYAFQIEMTFRALRHGFRVEEVPIIFADRRVGQSKMSKRIVNEAVRMVWRLRWADLRGTL